MFGMWKLSMLNQEKGDTVTKCLFCGQENDEEALFCYYCGNRITRVETTPFLVQNENEKISVPNEVAFQNNEPIRPNKEKKKPRKGLAVVLTVLAIVLVLGVVGAILINGGYITIPGGFAGINSGDYYEDDDYYDNDIEEYGDSNYDEQTEPYNYESNDEANSSEEHFPDELYDYKDDLIEVNKNYQVQLSYDDWYINIRSSPEFINIEQTENNIMGKMQSGTIVFVEYIYNQKWIVFNYDGVYAFASIYEKNDSSLGKLIFEVN